MSEPPAQKPRGSLRRVSLILLGLVFLAGVAFVGFLNVGVAYTNELEFCTSCHSMQVNLDEYKETIHYKNRSGVRATCSDCHVPKQFVPKMVVKIMAAKDVFHEIIGTIDTREKYEAHRWDMATRVWAMMKTTDSRECRSCHDFASMDTSAQDRSARSKHSAAPDKGQTCIDCHKGIAHKEPEEPEAAESEDSGSS
jgi:cytochrome c-type protein NapC